MKQLKIAEYIGIKEKLSKEIMDKCGLDNESFLSTEYILLYEENESIRLGAYIDKRRNMLMFPACKEWGCKIYNVCRFRIYTLENKHFSPVREEGIMEKEDFIDYYVLLVREEYERKYFLELYNKNRMVFSINVTDIWFKCGMDLKVIYTTEKDGLYTYWVYKENAHLPLLESSNGIFSKTEYFEKNKNIPIIINGDYIELFFHFKNCKRFYVAEYFARTKADSFSVLPKAFEDDDTCNYVAKFQKNRYEEIAFMNYCIQTEIDGYSVYGFSIKELEVGCIRTKSEKSLYVELNSVWKTIDYEKQCREILKHIYKMAKMEVDLTQVPSLKYFDKTHLQSTAVSEYLKENYKLIDRNDYAIFKEKYSMIYDELVKSGIVQVKWKSEYELYKVVKRLYPSAIFQYRSSWLKMQSLDIYIPDLKLGIEYQGEQHYRPIALFGGEEQFENRKKLDETKKKLCKKKGVKLIEWRYDERISVIILKKKIKECI